MEMIYQYVGITVFYLCLVVGLIIIAFYIFEIIMNFLGKKFKTLYIMVEYKFYRKQFKEFIKDKPRHKKMQEHLDSKKLVWEKIRIRQGWFLLNLRGSNKLFSIEDYHESGDYNGPMKFKIEDADKLLRFLNNYHKGKFSVVHWKTYDRLKNQLSLDGGVYARNYKEELKENKDGTIQK